MTLSDLLGWSGNFFLIAAMFLLGRKWRHAFALTFIGEILWLIESYRIVRWDMVFLCVVFAVLAAKNWWDWRTDT